VIGDCEGTLVKKETSGLQVLKELTDLRVCPAPLVNQGHLGTLVEKDPQDTREKGAQEVPLGNKVLPETTETMDPWVAWALKEERVSEASRDRKAPRELLVKEESLVTKDRGVVLAHWVDTEHVENAGSLGTRAKLVDREPRDSGVCRENQGRREHRGPKEREARQVEEEIRVCLEGVV